MSRSKQQPTAAVEIVVSEVTREEFDAAVKKQQKEFRDMLRLAAGGRILKIDCKSYRDARTLSQRLTATRSYYGFDAAVHHRGTTIHLSPRSSTVAIEDADGLLSDGDAAPSPPTVAEVKKP